MKAAEYVDLEIIFTVFEVIECTIKPNGQELLLP
jgi:hypothetical protein